MGRPRAEVQSVNRSTALDADAALGDRTIIGTVESLAQ